MHYTRRKLSFRNQISQTHTIPSQEAVKSYMGPRTKMHAQEKDGTGNTGVKSLFLAKKGTIIKFDSEGGVTRRSFSSKYGKYKTTQNDQ